MKFGMGNIKKEAVCPCCGKEWIEDDRYCRYCGAKKDNPKYIYPDFACIYGPAPVKRTHRCESCGYEWTTCLMIDNEAFCPKCGGSAPLKAQKGNDSSDRIQGMKVVAKSNVCYLDAKGEVCEKEHAVIYIITEYDKDGKLLNSVHGYINGSRNLINNIVEEPDEPDDDETMWLCPICKTFNQFKSKYCKNCGHPR